MAARVLAEALGRGACVGHAEFVDQAARALGFLEAVEVLALDVLDERQLRTRRRRRRLAHDDGHLVQPRASRGAPAALAGDQIAVVAVVADALGWMTRRLDRGGELLEPGSTALARLVLDGEGKPGGCSGLAVDGLDRSGKA